MRHQAGTRRHARAAGNRGLRGADRHLGHTIRAYDYRFRLRNPGHIYYRTPGVGHFATEVVVTEFIYNFGPRKLMRRLIFEGNVLVEIESIGYGYLEK